jgi:hypothetical protein
MPKRKVTGCLPQSVYAEDRERKRRAKIKDDALVKYVLERGLISARKIAKILECDIQDVDPNM